MSDFSSNIVIPLPGARSSGTILPRTARLSGNNTSRCSCLMWTQSRGRNISLEWYHKFTTLPFCETSSIESFHLWLATEMFLLTSVGNKSQQYRLQDNNNNNNIDIDILLSTVGNNWHLREREGSDNGQHRRQRRVRFIDHCCQNWPKSTSLPNIV